LGTEKHLSETTREERYCWSPKSLRFKGKALRVVLADICRQTDQKRSGWRRKENALHRAGEQGGVDSRGDLGNCDQPGLNLKGGGAQNLKFEGSSVGKRFSDKRCILGRMPGGGDQKWLRKRSQRQVNGQSRAKGCPQNFFGRFARKERSKATLVKESPRRQAKNKCSSDIELGDRNKDASNKGGTIGQIQLIREREPVFFEGRMCIKKKWNVPRCVERNEFPFKNMSLMLKGISRSQERQHTSLEKGGE